MEINLFQAVEVNIVCVHDTEVTAIYFKCQVKNLTLPINFLLLAVNPVLYHKRTLQVQTKEIF